MRSVLNITAIRLWLMLVGYILYNTAVHAVLHRHTNFRELACTYIKHDIFLIPHQYTEAWHVFFILLLLI